MSQRKPEWLKVRFNQEQTAEVVDLMQKLGLNTVCKEANCPNLAECYRRKTATFMILGKHCTRNCTFCNVVHNTPNQIDKDEPQSIAGAAHRLSLKHVVITSVSRDDLKDGGASHFVACVKALRELSPHPSVELLIPDFQGNLDALAKVIFAAPEVLNHNMETVASLYQQVRPQANYQRSLAVLHYARVKMAHGFVKTGIMLGLGETDDEIEKLLDDIAITGCQLLTIGQYLQPSPSHMPMQEYVTPEKFEYWRTIALAKGFLHCAAGPLVRSSYLADEAYQVGVREAK